MVRSVLINAAVLVVRISDLFVLERVDPTLELGLLVIWAIPQIFTPVPTLVM